MSSERPNILLILNDDMGYSDLGCYGGEVDTPKLDQLAAGGLRFTQFYNTARCCPSRASLMTGLHPHQTGIGHMMNDDGIDGYLGDLNQGCVTMAEVLRASDYRTYLSGKWHLTRHAGETEEKHNWPCQRGFDRFHGIIQGATDYFYPPFLVEDNELLPRPEDPDYYFTDDVSDTACSMINDHCDDDAGQPFFMYLAYTAPHWPLHAPEEAIAKYKGRFDDGWDALRQQRFERMRKMGLLDESWELSERDEGVHAWSEEEHKAWQTRRMEVYAAQIDIMDQGIGRVIETLKQHEQLDNTIIIFLADNGGCAEELHGKSSHGKSKSGKEVRYGNEPEIMPGADDTYASYGVPWANVSNTPFKWYKHWVHEGGIATPFIVHWPAGIAARGELRQQCFQLPDVMATVCAVSESSYPETFNGNGIKPCEGYSMHECFANADRPSDRKVLFWEHEGNCAVRKDQWKLVRRCGLSWELYDMNVDRSEMYDRSGDHPAIVEALRQEWQAWAERCGVVDYQELQQQRQAQAEG